MHLPLVTLRDGARVVGIVGGALDPLGQIGQDADATARVDQLMMVQPVVGGGVEHSKSLSVTVMAPLYH